MSSKENIIKRPIEEVLNNSFGKYAKYIIQDRALPDIRDGLKPVQRRILYAMYDLGITHDHAYKKSARSVGEVIGKYHPHGDSSIYEAMVRMSQEWKNNIPLIDMHGNKGSIDGDNAAAMRYTECRLSKISEYMLDNIEKKTVKFIPNFDDSESEPAYLPSLIPNLLINGATGIAAGYATNIPPFNICEVIDAIIYRIDYPNCSTDKIIDIMPGPDFPTGGIVNGVSGIHEAYNTGRGKVIINAELKDQVVNSKLKQIIITSIPYETNKTSIIKAIDDLVFNEKISGIKEVRDESDKNGIAIAIDIEGDKSLDTIKNFLLKNTPLQITYAINFIAIHNRKPVLMSITMAIDAYVTHALEILVKTLQFDLLKAQKRLEILAGLIKALSILDDIIVLIRKSVSKEDAKTNLINKFNFTINQAEAIVNLRLYKLSSTDVADIKKEHSDLQLIIAEISTILASEELLRNSLKKILRGHKQEFNIPRRTTIKGEIEKIVINELDLQENKRVIVMVTQDGFLKTTTPKSIETSNYGEFNLKTGDILLDIFNSSSLNQVILITNSGQYISIPCHKIKNAKYKDPAEHINNLITLDSNDKIIHAFEASSFVPTKDILLICTMQGQIKRIEMSELTFSKSAKSSLIFNLKNDDKVVACQVIPADASGQVICISKSGYGIRFNVDEIPIVGRTAAGVRAQKLFPEDEIIGCIYSNQIERHQILISSNRGFKRIHFKNIPLTKRANIGRLVMLQVKNNPYVLNNILLVNSRDIINVLNTKNEISTMTASDIVLTDLDTRFIDVEFEHVKVCYRDNWLSTDINKHATAAIKLDDEDEDDNDVEPVQESLF